MVGELWLGGVARSIWSKMSVKKDHKKKQKNAEMAQQDLDDAWKSLEMAQQALDDRNEAYQKRFEMLLEKERKVELEFQNIMNKYDNFTVIGLKDLLRSKELATGGLKEEMIARLRKHFSDGYPQF